MVISLGPKQAPQSRYLVAHRSHASAADSEGMRGRKGKVDGNGEAGGGAELEGLQEHQPAAWISTF